VLECSSLERHIRAASWSLGADSCYDALPTCEPQSIDLIETSPQEFTLDDVTKSIASLHKGSDAACRWRRLRDFHLHVCPARKGEQLWRSGAQSGTTALGRVPVVTNGSFADAEPERGRSGRQAASEKPGGQQWVGSGSSSRSLQWPLSRIKLTLTWQDSLGLHQPISVAISQLVSVVALPNRKPWRF
jgi:hypothetical protein